MLLLPILEKGNTYKIVKTKSEEKGSHERRKRKWEDNVWVMSCGMDLDGSSYGPWACKHLYKISDFAKNASILRHYQFLL